MNIKYITLIFLTFVFSLFKQSLAHELNKNEINSLINNFILKNPQVIEKTLQNLNLERSKKNFEIIRTLEKLKTIFINIKNCFSQYS